MRKTNSKSFVALTLGVLSIVVPYIGLFIGIIGFLIASKSINEIDHSNDRGRDLAVSGKVCSMIGISIQLLLILLIIFYMVPM